MFVIKKINKWFYSVQVVIKVQMGNQNLEYNICICYFTGETMPLATSNHILLRFNTTNGAPAKGFHFVYQGN